MTIQLCPASWELLARLDIDPTTLAATIPPAKLSAYIAAVYWLTDCLEEGNPSIRAHIEHCLEACYHLCAVAAWELIRKILLTPLHAKEKQNLDEMLSVWQYSDERIRLFSLLLGKFDRQLDAICWRALGESVPSEQNEFGLECLEKSRTFFLANGQGQEAARILRCIGSRISLQGGDYPKAEKYFRAALAELRPYEDYTELAEITFSLANIIVDQGKPAEAERYFEECLDIHTRILQLKNAVACAWVHLGYARCLTKQGEFIRSRGQLRSGIRIAAQLEAWTARRWLLFEWGILLAYQAKYLATHAVLHYLLNEKARNEPDPFVAWIYHVLGRVALKTGDYAQAANYFQQTLIMQQAMGHQSGIVYALDGLACTLIHQQRFEHGISLLSAAQWLGAQLQLGFPPFDRADSERSLALLRVALDPVVLDAAWQAGQRLSLDEAITAARIATGHPRNHSPVAT